MSEQQSYRQIMKATSLFGGVQFINIIISIVSTKFVALFLGPAGMGVTSLLNTTLGLIGGITNFGLGTSAVKDVSTAYSSEDNKRIAIVVSVFRRLVWITGLLGMLTTIILSPWLSELTFSNNNYTLSFILLSVTLLISQLSKGQSVVLQGMRKLQYLAKSSLYGSLLALCVSIPTYYFWGVKGIVPVIFFGALSTWLLTSYFSKKIQIDKLYVSKVRTLAEGTKMLQMGFLVSLSGLMSLGVGYLIRIYISRKGGLVDVGLFSAGFSIINMYVGLIFSAMSTDYFPRLSAASADNVKSTQIINHQAEIAILILAPLLVIFLVFIHLVIVLLYSAKFLAIDSMMYWAAIGIFFKTLTWSVGFIFLARGDKKIFFFNELFGNIYILIFNIGGYTIWGLTGLGISSLIGYIIYFIQIYFVVKAKYNFSFNNTLIKLFIIQFLLAISTFFFVQCLPQPYPYLLGSVVVVISSYYSFKEVDKRVGLMPTLFLYGLRIKNYLRR